MMVLHGKRETRNGMILFTNIIPRSVKPFRVARLEVADLNGIKEADEAGDVPLHKK
jgi:hypothetical protein